MPGTGDVGMATQNLSLMSVPVLMPLLNPKFDFSR